MTWTPAGNPLTAFVVGVCWASDREEFVAVGADNGFTRTVATSPEAVVWTLRMSPFDGGNGIDVVRALALGLYVAVGVNSDGSVVIMTSPDAVAWTSRGNPFSATFPALCIACKQSTGALVVGTLFCTQNIATSPDGLVWTPVSSPFDGNPGFVVTGGLAYSSGTDRWIAAGANSSSTPTVAYSDDDGATWTTIVTHPMTSTFGGVYRDEPNGNWYLLGQTSGGKAVAVSGDDGATWTEVSTPLDGGSGDAMIDVDGGLLGLTGFDSGGSSRMCVSTDAGATWTLDATPSPFGAFGSGAAFAYSPTLTRAVVGGEFA